jgi:UDP-GlcNAc:undecaprenyl-phosphate/decaprenyl-phosphate GlcNAc-1-phosphate transferase
VVDLLPTFNMLDNMDALSASVAWIAAGALVLLRHLDGTREPLPWLWLAFLAALAGFLWYNRPPARLYLGDVGSTFLGFFLGIGSLETALAAGGGDTAGPGAWAAPLCVLAVPCYDLATVVLLRLWQGRSPFHGDQQHLSHRLVALGLRRPAAVGIISLLALASGLAGLVLYRMPDAVSAILVGLQLAVVWIAVAGIEYVRWFRTPAPGSGGRPSGK